MQNIEAALASTSRSEGEWRNNIISRSQTMEQLLQEAEQIAGSDVSVLITGASGSGKELLANAIHKASSRCKKTFYCDQLWCAARTTTGVPNFFGPQ